MTSNSSSQESEEFSRLKREHERLKLRFNLQCQQKEQELEFERKEIENVEKALRQELSSLSTAMETLKRENRQLKDDRAHLEGLVERVEDELKRIKADRARQEIVVLEDGQSVERRNQEVQTESTSVHASVIDDTVTPHALDAVENSSERHQFFSENIEDRMRSVSLAPDDENRASQDHGRSDFGGRADAALQLNETGTEENGGEGNSVSVDEIERMDARDATDESISQHNGLNLDKQTSDTEVETAEKSKASCHGRSVPAANKTMQTTTKGDGDESATRSQHQRPIKLTDEYCRNAIDHLLRWNGTRAPSIFKLPPKVLYTRLQPLGLDVFPLTVDKGILDRWFSRTQLKKVHGAEPKEIFPKVFSASAAQYGYSRLMCLDHRLMPFAPRIPGAPGLFFSLWDPDCWPRQRELVIDGLGSTWSVMGEYKIERSIPLSLKEFQLLPFTCRERLYDWAFSDNRCNLARDALKKLGNSNYFSRSDVKSEVLCLQRYREDDFKVAEAFWEGKEPLLVWTMKCVGYTEKFTRALFPSGSANSTSAKLHGNSGEHYEYQPRMESIDSARSSTSVCTWKETPKVSEFIKRGEWI